MSATRNIPNVFGAVMRAGTAPVVAPARAATVGATTSVREFIECCDTVFDLVREDGDELLPGVATGAPLPTLKAYLLYLACEAPNEDEPGRVAKWHARVREQTWTLLGFRRGAPDVMTLEVEFRCLAEREHIDPHVRALVYSVRLFAGAGLLPAVRR